MNQGTEWGLLMKKNRSQKSRASVPLTPNGTQPRIPLKLKWDNFNCSKKKFFSLFGFQLLQHGAELIC